MVIQVKRIYDTPSQDDGFRVLVDRLWPRGISKKDAALDQWMKEMAPSDELRRWFSHDPKKWEAFRRRYEHELRHRKENLAFLRHKGEEGPLTLLYAAKNTEHNNAVVLRQYLDRLAAHESPDRP